MMNFHFLKILQCLTVLLINCSDSFTYPKDRYEGDVCVLDDGRKGICMKEVECPEKLQEIIERKRDHLSSDHCGFLRSNEIVCCPKKEIPNKIKTRIVERACEEFERLKDGIPNPTIFNGLAADINEFPFMAALGYKINDEIKYNCGGSLISQTFVLTAGHCVINVHNAKPVEIRFGSENLTDTNSYVQNVLVDKIYPHPNYNILTRYNDIALIKLKRAVQISDFTRPVCIQAKSILNLDTRNDAIVASGFGATSFENEGSEILLKTNNLSLVKSSQCNAKYRGMLKLPRGIDESMLCYIDDNKLSRSDACQGDSGGPLVMINNNNDFAALIGITSFGHFCGSSMPGVYTAVYNYLDWIESTVWGS